MRRWASLAVTAGVVITLTGAIWATQASRKPEGSAADEYRRCVKTCNVLMQQFSRSYPQMRVHEGDSQCWETCWARMDKGKPGAVSEMKKLWLDKMPSNMRINQCAQACWRKRHKDRRTVAVGGWKSEPRSAICE